MKSLMLILLALFVASCSSSSKKISLSNFELKKYQETTLENGLKVYFLKEEQLPYLSFNLFVKSGSNVDPTDKKGLTNLTMSLLEKGTKKRNATQLAKDLERKGASFDVGVNEDYSTAQLSGLSFQEQELFEDFKEILFEPVFASKEIERLKTLYKSQLSKFSDNPSGFASAAYKKLLFNDHPYGVLSVGTTQGLKNIKRKDIFRQYLKWVRPNNSYLAVVGKFSPELKQKIIKDLEKWESRKLEPADYPSTKLADAKKIRLLHRKGLNQAQIRMGHIGVERSHPDYMALRLANIALGVGFTSRLMSRIRDDLGLTYGINSQLSSNLAPGDFTISTFTRTEKVKETLSESIEIVKRFKESGISPEELQSAQNYLLGSFPQVIETPEVLAINLMLLDLYGVEKDYLERYEYYVRRVDVEDVNEALRKYIHPEKMQILVFGGDKKLEKSLKEIAEVEKVPLSKSF